MFNRNINPRQFSLDEEPAAPAAGPTLHQGLRGQGESIPFAGGTFNVAENIFADDEGVRLDKGAWISQSAQTVLPGSLSHGPGVDVPGFDSWPEQDFRAEGADPNQHIGIEDHGDRRAHVAVGYQEADVAHESLGATIRGLRGKRDS